MLINDFKVDSDKVQYTEEHIISTYDYQTTELSQGSDGKWTVKPVSHEYSFKTDRRVPKLG